MTRFIGMLAAALLVQAASVAADLPRPSAAQALDDAIDDMAEKVLHPPTQTNYKSDPDQGDESASGTAILRVCTRNELAAMQSAICPRPISPP